MAGVNRLLPDIGVTHACRAMRVDRSAVYRERIGARRLVAHLPPERVRPRPVLAFSDNAFSIR